MPSVSIRIIEIVTLAVEQLRQPNIDNLVKLRNLVEEAIDKLEREQESTCQ